MALISKETEEMYKQYKQAVRNDIEKGLREYFEAVNKKHNLNICKVCFLFNWGFEATPDQKHPSLADFQALIVDQETGEDYWYGLGYFDKLAPLNEKYENISYEIIEELFDVHLLAAWEDAYVLTLDIKEIE